MFRVLTEEEARKAKRWQAPDLTNHSVAVANTRQHVVPVKLGAHTSAPLLQAAHPLNAVLQSVVDDNAVSTLSPPTSPGTDTSTASNRNGAFPTTNVAHQNSSPDVLQTSYDDGYARGYAEGNAALHQQSVKQLNDIIVGLSAPGLTADDQILEQEVLALSVDIARLLLQREVHTQPDVMTQLVRAGIQQLPGATVGQTRVRLHPLDANLVREALTELPDVIIVDEPALNRGECSIESGASQVRSGVDDWLRVMAGELGILPDSHSRED